MILKDDTVKETSIHKMLKTLSHRGPDALGGFVHRNVGLGSARLSIVDIEGGQQPVVSADRKVVIVFNGEIFNYLELRDRLIAQGVAFHTKSEIEMLLQLYLSNEEEMFSLLNGQYAIAIWDGRQEKLILCRDRLGIRPLFWHLNSQGMIFASEVKAIATIPSVHLNLNHRSIIQTLTFWTNVGDNSAFDNISQIPAAHYLVYHKGKTKLKRYWDWPFSKYQEPLDLPNENAYFERFSEEINTSISRQRMADVPVGSYLSGGIDSSVAAICLRRQMRHGTLKTYSVTFEDPEYDESTAQKAVTDHFNFDHSSVAIHSRDISDHFPNVVWHAETPLFRTAPTPLFLLSRQVHKDGIKVVMTGEGADEILLGYDLFRETMIRRFWRRQPDSKWRGSLLKRLYYYLPQYRNPRYFNLLLDFYRPTLQDDKDPHYAMAVRWANAKSFELYLSDELRSISDTYDPIHELEKWLPSNYFDVSDIERAQSIEVLTLLSNYLLSSQGDRMSMAHAVEGRYPYLDHEFIEFAARLPLRYKLRGLKDKYILRNAFGTLIPDEVRNRPKVAYQAPDLKGFLWDGCYPDYVEDLLSRDRIRETGLFNPDRVFQLMEKGRTYDLSRVGHRDNMAFIIVLSTMLLDELFIQRRIEIPTEVSSNQEMTWV